MSSIVYMVAGLSSRFGGKIKQFAKVGKNNETLIELSMIQAKKAGFDNIIFVVGNKTELPFKEKFGNEFSGMEIKYAKQEMASWREKPWGTVDALICAKNLVDENFVICNGDDLYGETSLKLVKNFLEQRFSEDNKISVTIGYELGKVIPENGKTNRGIFQIDNNNNILEIKEVFEIEKNKLEEKGLNEKSLTSMNLFGLKKDTLFELEKKLNDFKEQNKENKKIECLLPVELKNLINENKLKMKLLKTPDQWFGVTNPNDEEIIKQKIAKI